MLCSFFYFPVKFLRIKKDTYFVFGKISAIDISADSVIESGISMVLSFDICHRKRRYDLIIIILLAHLQFRFNQSLVYFIVWHQSQTMMNTLREAYGSVVSKIGSPSKGDNLLNKKILCVGLCNLDIVQVVKSFPLEDSDQRFVKMKNNLIFSFFIQLHLSFFHITYYFVVSIANYLHSYLF